MRAPTGLLGFCLLGMLLAGCAPVTSSSAVSPTESARSSSPASPEACVPHNDTRQPGLGRIDQSGTAQAWVPPGEFIMGSERRPPETVPSWGDFDAEQPAHGVELRCGFWIDVTEVTNEAYEAFVRDGGYENKELWRSEGWEWVQRQNPDRLPAPCVRGEGTQPSHPRVCITWWEADAYATWRGGRLPTEAEWEFAARGPSSLRFPWGEDFDPTRLNMVDARGTAPVGSFPSGASWVGTQDMAGNAMEWVNDWFADDYSSRTPSTDPTGPADGTTKVKKGGWWGGPPYVARSAYRHHVDPPGYQDHHIGFRVVIEDRSPD